MKANKPNTRQDNITLSDKAIAAPSQTRERILDVADMILVASRLTEVLAEETILLRNMKVSAVEKLQEEKLKLVSTLEIYKQLLQKDHSLVKAATPQKLKELSLVLKNFEGVLEENHIQLLKVRSINFKVVEAVATLLNEQVNAQAGYNGTGVMGAMTMPIPPIAFSEQV